MYIYTCAYICVNLPPSLLIHLYIIHILCIYIEGERRMYMRCIHAFSCTCIIVYNFTHLFCLCQGAVGVGGGIY